MNLHHLILNHHTQTRAAITLKMVRDALAEFRNRPGAYQNEDGSVHLEGPELLHASHLSSKLWNELLTSEEKRNIMEIETRMMVRLKEKTRTVNVMNSRLAGAIKNSPEIF